MNLQKHFYFILVLSLLFSCKREETPLQASYLDLPAQPANYFEKSLGINNNLPELGRVLFYDKSLSINNSV